MSHNACCTRPAYTISLCSYYKIYRINYSGRFHNTLKLIKQDFDSWRGANATFLRGNVRAGEGKEEIPRSVGGIMGQVNSYVEVGQKAEDFARPGWLAGWGAAFRSERRKGELPTFFACWIVSRTTCLT